MYEKITHNLQKALFNKKLIRLAHTIDGGLEQTILPINQEIWYKFPSLDEDILKNKVSGFRPFPNRDRDRSYTYNHLVWKMIANGHLEKMKKEPVFFSFSNSKYSEEVCKEFGYQNLMPDNVLYTNLQNKNLLKHYGVDADHGEIPHIESMIEKIDYETLKNRFGKLFVIQFTFNKWGKHSSGGRDTYFVQNELDYLKIQHFKYKTPAKISKYIKGPSFGIHVISTSKGPVVLSPYIQAIGIPEITNKKTIFSGIDFSSKKYFNESIKKQIKNISKHIGRELHKKSYRGIFGIDFILDSMTEKVYVLEINPRFTAATNMLTFLSHQNKIIPPIAIHLAAHLDCIPESFDIKQYESSWGNFITGSIIHIRNIEGKTVQITNAPKPGIYKIENGKIVFIKEGYNVSHIPNKNHFLLTRIFPLMRNIQPLDTICRIQSLDSIYEDGQKLTNTYKTVISNIYKQFEFIDKNFYDSSVPYNAL